MLGVLTNPLAQGQRTACSTQSIAIARIVFGAIATLSMFRILTRGWITDLYAGPATHFSYPGFGWVRPPTEAVLTALVIVVGLAGVAIAVGWYYRPALAVFLVGFVWIELIDVTTYLNHYWFVTLLGVLLLFAPANGALSLRPGDSPEAHPGWVWLLRSQVAVVYVFAGLAKLSSDWLFHALPLRLWLPARSDMAVIGPLLEQRWVAFAASWIGAVFDCSVVVLLLWRRTRLGAWIVLVGFHVATWVLFPIGVFPWLMIGVSTLFFAPNWPGQLRQRLIERRVGRAVSPALDPLAAVDIARDSADPPPSGRPTLAPPRYLAILGPLWVAAMVLLPLRHLAIPGDARWTNEGYRFSWNVLLTEKGGDVRFRIVDRATGVEVIRRADDVYTPLQWKVMSSDPELIRQAAHELHDRYSRTGTDVAVYADAFVSFNGRPPARLIDPNVDLAAEEWRLGGQRWILDAPSGPPP
jgi:vitamin K-dependent gamma-carboxylase